MFVDSGIPLPIENALNFISFSDAMPNFVPFFQQTKMTLVKYKCLGKRRREDIANFMLSNVLFV